MPREVIAINSSYLDEIKLGVWPCLTIMNTSLLLIAVIWMGVWPCLLYEYVIPINSSYLDGGVALLNYMKTSLLLIAVILA